MRIVVFGTSLAWGQGLRDEEKMHNVLARMLEKDYPDVDTLLMAHSGAITGYKADGAVDIRKEPRLHGEVPTDYPTIVQQMDEFDDHNIAPAHVNLVILDAGINDISIPAILDPLKSAREIEYEVELYCYQHVKMLLRRVTDKFPNARVFLIGYYPFITEHSEEAYVHAILKAFNKLPAGAALDKVIALGDSAIKKRTLHNCSTFAKHSLEWLRQAAAEMNGHLTETDKARVVVVYPDFKPENAAFAPNAWIFGINEDLTPEDSLVKLRDAECHTAGITRTEPPFCARASAGHPNPLGAQAYAEAMFALL